jgi:hypothetical protein
MSVTLGYTRSTDNAEIIIASYDSPALAEDAIADQTLSDVSEYWLASFINTETNEPSIFAYIDV